MHLDCRLITDENKRLEECLALPSSSVVNLPPRLGGLNFEKKLIRKQVLKRTGKILLPGYSSEDEQIVDLTMNGRRVKGLTIGVELTNGQIDSLEKNILWMVKIIVKLPDGNMVEALYPQVYIVSTTEKPDILMGIPNSLVSANRVDLTIMNSFVNEGVWNSNDINLNANTVLNRKGIMTAESMSIHAKKDIANESGIMLADKMLTLNADRDVNIITNAITTTDSTATVQRTDLDSMATVFVRSRDGELNVKAGRNINMKAAQIGNAGAQSTISAGNDINFSTVQVKRTETIVWDEDSRSSTKETRDIGSNVKVSGDLKCMASQDINITATSISAGANSESLYSITPGTADNIVMKHTKDSSGKLELSAGRNLNVLSGLATCDFDEEHTSRHEFTFSESTVYKAVCGARSYWVHPTWK